jgi:hypothetical protein
MKKELMKYPFLTRAEIQRRLASDGAFVHECARILQARTTERLAGRSPADGSWGWMSSETVVARKLVARLETGPLSAADEAKLCKLVGRYSRQLAEHYRGLALRERPELAEVAARFGVAPRTAGHGVPPTPEPPAATPATPVPADDPEPQEPEDDALPARVLAFVGRNPGQRTAEIAKALDTTTAMIAPALRALVQGKKLAKRGVGRGTRYSAR